MALPVPPINPNTPIQNNPFYYPETNYLKGEYGPFIVGSGFSINNATGTIDVSSGGGGPTILAGVGIAVTSGTGTVTITNTGIRTVTAGAGISVSVAGGNLNIVNTQPAIPTYGTVTSVATGTGLTGGPITSTGTISLETVGSISPGTYTNATITVDAYGRVTYAAPGSGTGSAIYATAPLAVTPTFPQTISIQAASTASSGAVQLNTSTSSTSTTQAATPSAVKQAYDLGSTAASNAATALSTATGASAAASTAQATANSAQSAATAAQTAATSAQGTATAAATSAAAAQAIASAAIPCSSFTAKGQLLAATGPSTFNALPPGTNGQVLIACSSCTSGLTWSSQPLAVGTVTAVNTGIGLLGGPITSTGTITLAPTTVTPGTYTYANVSIDTYGRITAAGNGVPPIPCAAITGKGVVLTGTAANAPTALPSGPNGYVLTACSACATGLTWAVAATSGIPSSAITAKGALITGTAPGVVSTLPVGSNGFVLTADSACADGLKWAAAAAPTTPATPSTEGVVYASTKNSASFATALGFNALNTTVTGVGNVALGSSAGCSLTSGQFNTFVGSGAGCANTTGLNNIALGSQALNAQVSGNCNIAIGNLAGINLTTECGNVIVGPYQGVAGCDNNVYIADGTGTLRVRVNENGAIAIGGSGYGSANQVLTSGGTTGSPTWTTIVSTGGTVTSITPGTGLCASSNPITVSGTICLTDTGVTAASYTNASITVDAQGRLTAASSGTAPVTAVTGTSPIAVTTGTTPVVSICSASTTALGAVQLTNALNSTSETLALTACAGQCLQSQITALAVSGTVELAGTIDASTGLVASITSVGSADGYTVGAVLPAASATTVNTYVIVTTPGTMTPPGGSATVATRGDWFLVSETSPGVYAWTFLNVGFDAPAATTTVAGIVCLSTNALAQAGTDTTTALTPAAAASAFIPNGCITAKGSLISGTAACSPTALTVGSNGQFLAANSACSSGLEWVTGCFIPCACITAKGAIITGTAANTPTALPVGLDGQYLVANAACTTGLEWVSAMGDTPVGAINWFSASTAPLGWLVADGSAVSRTTYAALFAVVGTTYGAGNGTTTFNLPDLRGQFLRGWDAAGGTARNCDPGRVFGSNQGSAFAAHCHTALVVGGLAGRPEWALPDASTQLGAGYPGCIAGSPAQRAGGFTTTIGGTETRPTNVALLPCIKWQVTTAPSSCGIPCACITAKGALITGAAANTPVALPVGTNGQTLIACSACASGLTWATPNVNPQKTVNRSSAVTLATEITTNSMVTGDSLTIYNNNTATPPAAITITAATLANYQSYPTQATSTVFTLPPQGTVTLILSDSATNAWYIESYDTPEQVGTVVVKARMSSGFTLSANAKIPLNTAIFNPQGYFDTTNNRFQPQVAGYYQVNAQILGDATAWMIAQIKKNGVVEIQSEQTSSPNTEAVPLAGIVYLNGSTDYLELWGTSSSSTTLNADPQFTYFTASLINQTNTRVVGIDAVARMEITSGNLPNNPGAVEISPPSVGMTTNVSWNPQGWFDATTGKFTPTVPGYYHIDAYVTSNNSNVNTWVGIFKNGVKQIEGIQPLGGTGNWQTSSISTVVFMNGATDYLRIGAGSQGATPGIVTQNGMSGMSISLVGANQAQPIPPMTWINAGTVQSVGFNAINIPSGTAGTAPTITASTVNNIRYRQIGPKEWEVQGYLVFTNGTAGSGDYILTLPGGLQFDTTSYYQLPYTQTPNDGLGWGAFGLIGGWVAFSQSGATTYNQSYIMPYDATRYRIFPYGPSTLFWNSSYYAIGAYTGWRKWGFTFFTP